MRLGSRTKLFDGMIWSCRLVAHDEDRPVCANVFPYRSDNFAQPAPCIDASFHLTNGCFT